MHVLVSLVSVWLNCFKSRCFRIRQHNSKLHWNKQAGTVSSAGLETTTLSLPSGRAVAGSIGLCSHRTADHKSLLPAQEAESKSNISVRSSFCLLSLLPSSYLLPCIRQGTWISRKSAQDCTLIYSFFKCPHCPSSKELRTMCVASSLPFILSSIQWGG